MIEDAWMSGDLSRTELLERLRESKRPVTSRQLTRWRGTGAVAPPKRRYGSGVRGSKSYFPTEAFNQAAAMFDRGSKHETGSEGDRRLSSRAFGLWWSGKSTVSDAREILAAATAPFSRSGDRIRAEGRTDIVGEAPEDADDDAFDVADNFVVRHRHERSRTPLVRRLWRNLERRDDDFASVLTAIVTVALGGHPFRGERASTEDEPSLTALVLKAFADSALTSLRTKRGARGKPRAEAAGARGTIEEIELVDFLEPVSVFADRERLRAFARNLDDAELEAARVYTKLLFEDVPEICEAYEVRFGQTRFTQTIQLIRRSPAHIRAFGTLSVAWLVRKHGTARFETLLAQCKDVQLQARGICTVAREFPAYRELLLERNDGRLAALHEEVRERLREAVKRAIPN
jgi:hypothetical protein